MQKWKLSLQQILQLLMCWKIKYQSICIYEFDVIAGFFECDYSPSNYIVIILYLEVIKNETMLLLSDKWTLVQK